MDTLSGPGTGGLLVGVFVVLLGIAAVVAALLRRRGRARYPETYAATGGIFYTIASMGCGVVLLLGGVGLIVFALVAR